MEENEVQYRRYLQSSVNLVVAFFEEPSEFPDALETVRQQFASDNIEADRACLLYRSRCRFDVTPRWRVWTQLVPFKALSLPDAPHRPWFGLDRDLGRAMTDDECQAFFNEKRFEVYEIRVSKRPPSAAARP